MSAADDLGCGAVHDTLVLEPIDGFVRATLTLHYRHHGFADFGFQTENFGDGFGYGASAGDAVRDANFAFHDCFGESGTSGFSTGAAIGSRQYFKDLFHSGINFHV
jgi:hypothetical protein